jgi:hypothetical protein
MTVDQLVQLEDERMETMVSPSFQEWMKSLNVSRLHPNKEPLINAAQMTSQYNYERKNKVARLMESIYL